MTTTPTPGPALPAVPDDAVVLHIGVHKTGTTSLQTRLNLARDELARRGVTYPGRAHAHHTPAMAAVETIWSWQKRPPEEDRRVWNEFATGVRATPGKVLLSSEFFCQADDAQAERVVDGIGRDRVHVLVGFRHLADLLPSSWQQYLKTGRRTNYETWLRATLADPADNSLTPSFWKRNDVPEVLRRWTDLVGAERTTIVVVELSDRDRLARSLCELLDVPASILPELTAENLKGNRSMSVEEAEFIRQVNLYAREHMPSPRYTQLMRNGAIARMVESRTVGEHEHKLGVPDWATDRILEIANQHVAAINATVAAGAHLVGDPAALVAPFRTTDRPPATEVPIEAAAAALIGALERTNSYVDRSRLNDFTTRQLLGEAKRRTQRRARRILPF